MNQSQPKLSRRRVFAGVGAAGAVAAVAAVVPAVREEAAEQGAKPAPEKGGGYRLSQHVLRYYQTTRI